MGSGALVIDLGSGGGVPGLVVAEARPDLRLVLLDAMEKRTALLEDAVVAMGVSDRVRVVTGRAEVLGRDDGLRGDAAAVTARSFGPPAATAECAAPLLAVGGLLVVSEPPDAADRWPTDPLAALGLDPSDVEIPGMKVLHQTSPCPERYPRRNGLPAKRPLLPLPRRSAEAQRDERSPGGEWAGSGSADRAVDPVRRRSSRAQPGAGTPTTVTCSARGCDGGTGRRPVTGPGIRPPGSCQQTRQPSCFT